MSYTVSMDKAGRLVIPKEIRERIGASRAMCFELDIVLNRIELIPKEQNQILPEVLETAGVWVVRGTGKQSTTIVDAISQDRIDQMNRPPGKRSASENE